MKAQSVAVSFNEDERQAGLELLLSDEESISYVVDENGEFVECRRRGRAVLIGNHHGFAFLASCLTDMLVQRDVMEIVVSRESYSFLEGNLTSIRFQLTDD